MYYSNYQNQPMQSYILELIIISSQIKPYYNEPCK
ncbi:hypothetical protein CLOL250_01605 [Clostridium sp. L2-50]|nr:hypothetical protein CLOL250_01605 [Clostridium sp. L2-50]